MLLDLDGTVYTESGPIPGADRAVDELRDAGVPLRFVTNTTRVPRSTIAGWLAEFGIRADADDVFTPPLAAADWLRRRGRGGTRRVALCLPEHTFVEFEGLELVDQDPDVVVIGDLGAGWTFPLMNRVFRWILDGADFLALHRNRYWLTDDGLTLDVGAFVAAFEYATGRRAELVGKPSRAMFEAASASMDLEPADVAMVGDDLEADIAGMQECGGQAIMVRTGKFRAQELADSGIEPDALIDSIAELPDLVVGH